MDLRMCCCGDVFALVTELFEQFFAGAQPGKFDLNIPVRHTARELNQLAGQIQDFDRLAHIEQENLSTLPLSRALEHQSDRLGDGHEIPSYVRMCHFDGAASGNLFVE